MTTKTKAMAEATANGNAEQQRRKDEVKDPTLKIEGSGTRKTIA
jgi:hypothetical protein